MDDVEDMIVELAAKLADGGRDALREKTEWVLHSIACRAAIKAGTARTPPRCSRWPSASGRHGPAVLPARAALRIENHPEGAEKAVWPTCLNPASSPSAADGQRQDRTFRRVGQSL